MNFLKNLVVQLKSIWDGSSTRGRALFAMTAIGCAVISIAVGVWSSRPEYVPLAIDLVPAQAAEIVSKLEAEGISCRLNYSGSGVQVPKNEFSRARLAAGDHLDPVSSESADSEHSIFLDPAGRQDRQRRYLEQSLARSITQLKSVERARVHISLAERSPFAREQAPPKASVILKLRPNRSNLQDPAPSVVAILVGGVERLESKHVRVADSQGQILFDGSPVLRGNLLGLLEYRRNVEMQLAERAERMLAKSLGPGKAVVEVSADIDFTSTYREETVYDPESKAKKEETIINKSSSGGAPRAIGTAGAASNLAATTDVRRQSTAQNTKDENITTVFELGKTFDRVDKAGGTIQRLTIAAMLDIPQAADGADATGTTMTKEDAMRIIKNAVGFDDQRSDQIEVTVTKLIVPSDEFDKEYATAVAWEQYAKLARHASLGIAALAALVFGVLLLRRLQPLTSTERSSSTERRERFYADLTSRVDQDPEGVSRIIAAWLGNAPGDDAHGEATIPFPDSGGDKSIRSEAA